MKLDTPGKRLNWIISAREITAYQFAKDLGYKSPDSIYHIINGRNNISDNFFKKLAKSNFKINPTWVKFGIGEPFLYTRKGQCGNEYMANGEKLYPARLDFCYIKRIASELAKIILPNPENYSYIVDVRVSLIEGLEFLFTTFSIQDDIKYGDRQYSLILQPDWEIGNFFEYWRIYDTSKRGENMLKGYRNFAVQSFDLFENSIAKILENIEKDCENEDLKPFLMLNDPFKEIYRTDSREYKEIFKSS